MKETAKGWIVPIIIYGLYSIMGFVFSMIFTNKGFYVLGGICLILSILGIIIIIGLTIMAQLEDIDNKLPP